MKRLVFPAIAGAALLTCGAADAADMALKARPPVPPPVVFTWTGCYIGAHAGGGWQSSSFVEQRGLVLEVPVDGGFDSGIGFIGGGQVGCNAQWNQFVIGVEGEYWGSGLRDRFFFGEEFRSFESIARNRWDASVSVRSGVAFDRAFIYGKLGIVWGKFDYSAISQENAPFFSAFDTTTGSATFTGVLIGVGFEYALTNNWTAKFEYNLIDYGNHVVNFTESGCDPGGCSTNLFSQTVKERKQIAKIGLNYLFGPVGKAPVAAAY